MRKERITESQVRERADRTRKAVGVAVLVVLLAVLAFGKGREYRYKAVIYDYERQTGQADNAPDSSAIVRNVGRPGTAYYRLAQRPRYRHFWESYR